jgi:CTP synthase
VQVIPHITNLIKDFIKANTADLDFVIIEIGGTVGDIEGLPFFEAIRQLGNDLGKKAAFVHLTLVPYIAAAKELKTKPTQHSVKELRSIGIQPNIILCRCERPIPISDRKKIALFCNVAEDAVIEAMDTDIIYSVPLNYHREGFDKQVLKAFGIADRKKPDLAKWEGIIANIKATKKTVKIALIGKYVSLKDSYKSVIEALDHAGIAAKANVEIEYIDAEDFEKKPAKGLLKGVDGILIPGGFGERGSLGKQKAIGYARENNLPFLGICFGMQMAVVEFARNVLGLKDATSSEFGKKSANILVGLIGNETDDKGGTMRLGSYPAKLTKGSLAAKLYGGVSIDERHRHRYEVIIKYKPQLEKAGMLISGISPDDKLPEIIEIKSHKFFIACQFHPEFKSRPFAAHPLFVGLINASVK